MTVPGNVLPITMNIISATNFQNKTNMKLHKLLLWLIVWGYTSQISGQETNPPVQMGTWGAPFSYTYTIQDMNTFPGGIAFLQFTLTARLDVTITCTGSNINYYTLQVDGKSLPSEAGGSRSQTSTYETGNHTLMIDALGLGGSITVNFLGATPTPASSYQLTQSKNYIFSSKALSPVTDPLQLNAENQLIQVEYFDGLGRLEEKVELFATPSCADLVSYQTYDSYGRESQAWLSAVSSVSNKGAFLPFSTFSANAITSRADIIPYETTIYETSPLNRETGMQGAGNAWNGYPKTTAYLYNQTSMPLSCTQYVISTTGTLTSMGNYPAATLTVRKETDEDGNCTYIFQDKLQRVILVRQQNGTEYADTYYVYDDAGLLHYVLPPAMNGSISEENLNRLAFRYQYDQRNRCILKKQPGAEAEEYVYDTADRMIFSQNGNQRTLNRWTFYEYDTLDRLTRQGECTGRNVSSNPTIHLIHYYDNYNFRNQSGFNHANFTDGGSNGRGALTGSIIYPLGEGTTCYEAYYYDLKGRIIKTVQSNSKGGYDIRQTTYTFTGQPQTVTQSHTATGQNAQTSVYTYAYDTRDRLISISYKLNQQPVVKLAELTYDDFERIKTKKQHGSIQTTYTYNLRDWMTGISGIFNQTLCYTNGTGTPKYNGNISSMTWSTNDNVTRGYKFSYDGMNRLTAAIYGEGSSLSANTNRYTENITAYDLNGNIKNLQRYGKLDNGSYGLIDNLTCELTGNQLKKVTDTAATPTYSGAFHFKDGANNATEYAYDANGNMTRDDNKGISSITYNAMNLPQQVTFTNGNKITWQYGADGVKRKVTVTTSGVTTTYEYCGNIVYKDNAISQILTDEGYITLNGTTPTYHYYQKDHQGNHRMVVNSAGTVEQVNHYYALGGVFGDAGTNPELQRFKYNGKELDRSNGLDWYDYGARHYDPALGRWITPDPMAEKYYPMSPYSYTLGNPIIYKDPNGTDAEITIQGNTITIRANIFICGKNASKQLANIYQQDINNTWGKIKSYKYNGREYDIVWNVRVLVDNRENIVPKNDGISNYMKVASNSSGGKKQASKVEDAKSGIIYSVFKDGKFYRNSAMSHEFGHMLGLKDKYQTDKDDPNYQKPISAKWKGNIMAEPAGEGQPDNKNMQILLNSSIKEHLQSNWISFWSWFGLDLPSYYYRNIKNHE